MPVGCAVGGAVITVYFIAGGLLTSAWVNVVQLAVKLAGSRSPCRWCSHAAGGWSALASGAARRTRAYWTFWRADVAADATCSRARRRSSISPGSAAEDASARATITPSALGVGLNALGLFLYAGVPVVLGIACRAMFPPLADSQLALPTVLMQALPPLVGAIGRRRGVLGRDQRRRRRAADADDVAVAGSVQAVRHAGCGRRSVLAVARWATLGGAAAALALALDRRQHRHAADDFLYAARRSACSCRSSAACSSRRRRPATRGRRFWPASAACLSFSLRPTGAAGVW